RVGGRRKFFLEAKKPSLDIKNNPEPAFQLRRYAWSAKLPLSILSDFEELAVYDCRLKPEPGDPAAAGRVFFYRYPDYLERWPELEGVFSKEAVLKGSFDKFAESAKKKKGTAEVDAAFLKEIESWREALAKNIALRNPRLTNRELNFAVQATLDRIIFIRICEDRGIENYGILQALLNGQNLYRRLFQLFDHADDKYNSGLFHFKPEKDRPEPDTLTPRLNVDDKPLKEILKRLYYPESPYEFSVLPADILGQVYEQFLGKVIRLTAGHQAKVEDKPEVKKAGGVYYTPTYIVDYIVKNTVGRLLEGKTPENVAATAPRSRKVSGKKKQGGADIPVCQPLRILDPACGSGSFLLGAYQYLLDWYLDQHLKQVPEKHRDKLYEIPRADASFPSTRNQEPRTTNRSYRLTTAERKRILLDHVFGVDIDPQAVEVTKLSLLLKCLEGETEETLKQMMLFHKERALPDLSHNIQCGNSLIGPDFYQQKQLSLIDEEERYRINVFDWKTGFPEVFKGDNPGFDVVIGNPPYGAEFSENTYDYLKRNFETYVLRGESYLIFVEKVINLLKIGGILGYIIPDTYLNLTFTQVLRNFLLKNTDIMEIVQLPSRVFPGTTVDTTLLFVHRVPQSLTFIDSNIIVKLFNKNEKLSSIDAPAKTFQSKTKLWHEQGSFNLQASPSEYYLLSIIEKDKYMLSAFAEMFSGIKAYEVGKGSPPQTKLIRDTKPFTSDVCRDKSFKPFYDGKHIGRYQLIWQNNNWIKYGEWLAAPRSQYNFEGEKLLVRKIVGKTLIATYIPDTSYCNTLTHIIKLLSNTHFLYKYLLGIINSTLIGWYFKKKFQISCEDTFPQIMIEDIMKFPIKNINIDNDIDKQMHDRMVELVETMLDLHKRKAAAKVPAEREAIERQIAATDREIDGLVYELYGLTDEEIKIVEGEP
ncbi:MAG: hypothetical protein A2V67_02665, partial [Deltaproteobacteria bacterium RBG_13_61_14]